MHNEGVPAWSSGTFEPCLGSIVPRVSCLACTHCVGLSVRKPLAHPAPTHMRTQDADLVVVEFAVNDYAAPDVSGQKCPAPVWMALATRHAMLLSLPWFADINTPAVRLNPQYSYTSKARRCYEQLLRRLLRWPSQPTVLLLQYYPWWRSLGDGILDGLYYREPETEMTVLGQVKGTAAPVWLRPASLQAAIQSAGTHPSALLLTVCCLLLPQYYDLPVVSLRAAAWRLMQAGIDGLKVRWRPDAACQLVSPA